MPFDDLINAVSQAPPGKWAVGVSGGADSIALLHLLLRTRSDLPQVVHLNHELRGEESDADAGFVERVSQSLGLGFTIERASTIARHVPDLPANIEARGRAMRFWLFEKVVRENDLQGVILAHHADDQAETILMRLMRGSLWWTLRGMDPAMQHGELLVMRPLLSVCREQLRQYLQSFGGEWREDSSNESARFTRNRVRRLLEIHSGLMEPALELARSCDALCDWIDGVAPALPPIFAVGELADRPRLIAHLSAMRWLLSLGCPPAECSTDVVDRLITMCRDAATPARRHFPGGIEIRRRGGVISATVA